MPYGYSAVFNLRDDNIFEFEVPYVSQVPYVPFSSSIGSLAMYLIDKLQAPSMVSSTISFMVEVCGGDDFEVANPTGVLYPAHVKGVTLQSGKWLSCTNDEMAQHTIGEHINSFKQLIAIPKSSGVYGPTEGQNQGLIFDIPPWYYQPMPSDALPGPASHLSESFGYGGNIATCYAFVKGGTDFHAYVNKYDDTAIGHREGRILVSQNPTAFSLGNGDRSPACGGDSSMPTVKSINGIIHTRLPAYQAFSRYPSSIVNGAVSPGLTWSPNGVRQLTTGNSGFSMYRPASIYRVFADAGGVRGIYQLARSAADDAAMAHYMGPPPLCLLNNNTTGGYDPDSAFFSVA
jgi:hypothetical protein